MACNKYDVEHRRNPYTRPAKEIEDAVKVDMNTPWEFNRGMLKTLLDELGEDTVKELLGYTPLPSDTNPDANDNMPYDKVQSIRSQNLAIQRSIDSMKSLEEQLQVQEDEYLPTDIYFDYFVAKNGRPMIDSEGVNPQSDKLHRFMFTTQKQEAELDPKNNKDMEGFKMAIAQAFGFAIDKSKVEDSLEFAENVMKIDSLKSKVMDHLKSGKKKFVINGIHMEVEHLSHMLMGLEEISKYRQAKGKPFKTKMTFEVDALTSGFALKMMQMPLLDNYREWLSKTGVVIDGRKNMTKEGEAMPEGGMADVKSEGYLDSYQTLAAQMGSKEDIIGNMKTIMQEKGYEARNIATKLGIDIKVEDGEVVAMLESMVDILPEIVKDGKVTGDGRTLFKKPFMTFNYGAGFPKIKAELAYSMMENIITNLHDYSKNGKDAEIDLEKMINTLGIKEVKTKEGILPLYKALELYPASEISVLDKDGNTKIKLDTMLLTLTGESYGNKVKSILETEFAPIVNANEAVNNTMKLIYRVYDRLLGNEMKGKAYNKEDMLEVFEKYKEAFPIIRSPLGNGIEDGIAIFKTQMAYNTEGIKPATLLKDGNGKTIYRSTQTVERILEEAGAASSVVPIHTLDSAIINTSKTPGSILQIFDAEVLGVKQPETEVKQYNEKFLEINKNWSLLEEVEKAFNRVTSKFPEVADEIIQEEAAKSAIVENLKADRKEAYKDKDYTRANKIQEELDQYKNVIDPFYTITNLQKYKDQAQETRKEMFSKSIEVENMVYMNNTAYKQEVQEVQSADTTFKLLEDIGKEIPAELKAEYDKIMKNLEDCM